MKKKLEKRINLFLSAVIILVLLPLLLTIFMQRLELSNLISGIPQGTEEVTAEPRQEIGYETEEAEALLVGIVAKEIGADSSKEAIMAQCVIARTNLYAARETGTAEPEALEIEEMEALWGDNFQGIYRRMEECVEQTKGQVLVWNNDYIYAAYHAISAGQTRNMSEMYADSDMPYLTEQICVSDTTAEGYLAVYYYEESEFMQQCRQYFPEAFPETSAETDSLGASGDAPEEVEVTKRDHAGYVLEMRLGGGTCSGEDFRDRFGLNSACFTVTKIDGQIRIVTKGLGHGFGLSQYSAECMAAEGLDYQKILEFFYPGSEIRAAEEFG